MKFHMTDPKSGWLQFNGGIYLLTVRDGPLSDFSIGMGIYYAIEFDHPEYARWDDQYVVVMRHLFIDDTRGGIHLDIDCLINRGTMSAAEQAKLLLGIDGRLSDMTAVVPHHGQSVSYDLSVHHCNFGGDHFSLYGGEWFKRFLS